MALVGAGNGGFALPMPAGLDFTKGHALWLYVRRTGTSAGGARLLAAFSASRNTGFQLQFGGYSGATSATGDAVLTVGAGATSGWGASGSSGGRGRAVLGAVTDVPGQWTRLAANIEWVGGAQRVARWWRNGLASTAVASETVTSSLPATGGTVNVFARDAGATVFANGLIAELCWWQDHQLSDADIAALEAGADPQTIAPAKRFVAAHWSGSVAPEVGAGTRTTIGTLPTANAADHPALGGGAGDTITLDDFADWRVFQRRAVAAERDVVIRGGFAGPGAVGAIEYRIEDFATGLALAGHGAGTIGGGDEGWATLVGAPGAGAFVATRTVAAGGWYRTRVRSRGAAVLATAAGANRWGVGQIILVAGQSNSERMRSRMAGQPVANPLTAMYWGVDGANKFSAAACAWSAPQGHGLRALLDLEQQRLGVPVAAIPAGVDSTALLGDYSGNGSPTPHWWLDEATAAGPYRQALAAVDATGGDVGAIDWMHGEAEAKFSPAPVAGKTAAYRAGMTTLYGRLLAHVGRTPAQCPIVVTTLGRGANYIAAQADANFAAVRAAQVGWSRETAGAVFGGSMVTLPLADSIHFTDAAYATRGAFVAQALRRAAGAGFGPDGPELIDAVYDAGTGRLRLTYDGRGGALAGTIATTGLTGFEASADGFATLLPSAAAIAGPDLVEIALPVGLGSVAVRYGWGQSPDVSNALVNVADGAGAPTGYPAASTVAARIARSSTVTVRPASARHELTSGAATIGTVREIRPANARHAMSDAGAAVGAEDRTPLVTEVATERRLVAVGR